MTRDTIGSPAFIRRTRNPDLEPPRKFEPTRKAQGEVVISTWQRAA